MVVVIAADVAGEDPLLVYVVVAVDGGKSAIVVVAIATAGVL